MADQLAQVKVELVEVEAAIAACAAGENYRRRLALIEQGMALGATVGELASAAGVDDGTYRQALHKARRRASA
jgi:hypothetical protein